MDNYICECGAEFNNHQSFNGHKCHCTVHAKLNNKLNEYNARCIESIKRLNNVNKVKHERKLLEKIKQEELWILEKHVCKTCGKVMTKKFGSGLFCSRSCANTRTHSELTKSKISQTYRTNPNNAKQLYMDEYAKNPSHCVVCNAILPYNRRFRKTCSNECLHELRKLNIENICKKPMHNMARRNFKFGWYKNFWCDSSWELAFVMYCLYNNLNIKQCLDSFDYTYKGVKHKYTPDFIIDNTYYEIKGYCSDKDLAKINSLAKNISLIVIDKNNIDKYLSFAIEQFGNEFYKLYDNEKPNWQNCSTTSSKDSLF